MTADVTVGAYLLPQLQVNVYGIGGPLLRGETGMEVNFPDASGKLSVGLAAGMGSQLLNTDLTMPLLKKECWVGRPDIDAQPCFAPDPSGHLISLNRTGHEQDP